MKYKYYAEVESDIHHMYASELAEWLKHNYGIVAESGKAHIKMVQALLEDTDKVIAAEQGLERSVKLYYNTRNGLKRVYVSAPRIVMRVEKLFLDNDSLTINAGGKNFKYKIMEKEHE